MNSAILAIIEQHQAIFMDRLTDRFEIPREQMEEIWEEVRKIKMKKIKKIKKVSVPSAYVLFCRAKRQGLKDMDMDMDFGKISKELGRMWRDISPEEKLFYATENNRLRREKAANLPSDSDAEAEAGDHSDTESVQNDDVKMRESSTTNKANIDTTSAKSDESATNTKEKAIRKKKTVSLPEDIAGRSEADQQLWIELSKLKLADLRTQGQNRNLIPAKTREEMLRSLLNANSSSFQVDEEDDDNDRTQCVEEEE
jgi:hypothetical protein